MVKTKAAANKGRGVKTATKRRRSAHTLAHGKKKEKSQAAFLTAFRPRARIP